RPGGVFVALVSPRFILVRAGYSQLPSAVPSPCFFEQHGVHRDLHPFPTRRSSDLSSMAGHVSTSSRSPRPGVRRASRLRSSRTRSEEHTSELQSREKLVCRLLLEKKKMTPTSRNSLAQSSADTNKYNERRTWQMSV